MRTSSTTTTPSSSTPISSETKGSTSLTSPSTTAVLPESKRVIGPALASYLSGQSEKMFIQIFDRTYLLSMKSKIVDVLKVTHGKYGDKSEDYFQNVLLDASDKYQSTDCQDGALFITLAKYYLHIKKGANGGISGFFGGECSCDPEPNGNYALACLVHVVTKDANKKNKMLH